MPKIMLVEDDNNLREIYGERLMAEGYEIIAASDGEEALAMAVKEKPDLIISDVMMPKISGFDMLDILRQTPETKNTKVIMMTALSQTEDKDRADRLGADKYLVKSQVTLEDVARVVHDMLYATTTTSGDTKPETPQNPPIIVDSPVVAQPPASSASEDEKSQDPIANINDAVPATPIEDTTPVVASSVESNDNSTAAAIDDDGQNSEATNSIDQATPSSTTLSENVDTAKQPDTDIINTAVDQTPATETTTESVKTVANPETSEAVTPTVSNSTMPTPNEEIDSADTVNPISGDAVQPEITNTNTAGSATAVSANEELESISKTIENFVATDGNDSINTPTAPQAPIVEPTEQDMIHAQNAAEEPKVEQPPIATNPNLSEPNKSPEPRIEVPPALDPKDNVIEPASSRKKIIQPINNPSSDEHSINELYEKEIAKEQAETPINNPASGETVDAQSNNPITSPTENTTPLQTADTTQISGLSYGDDQQQEQQEDIALPKIETVQSASPPQETPETEAQQDETDNPANPHGPDQIAL